VDRRRLADVRAGTADGQRSGGSGYLISRTLVLTCRHVIQDEQGRMWPRLEVRLRHPADGPSVRLGAAMAWVHPDPTVDAALLRVDGEGPPTGGLVRWGWFAGASPVPYTGLGFPEFAGYESGRGVEQLAGTVSPLAIGAGGGLVLDQAAAPEMTAGRAWPGISGAAVFCQGLLTAVVRADDQEFGNRRLHAVPASGLAAEPGFAAMVAADAGTAPVLEAVELAEFLQPPGAVEAHTPGSLLAPAAETVEFTGRSGELAQLAAWRDGGESFSVLLMAGEGGQGKTRLGRQFAAACRRSGWVTGFLAARPSIWTNQGEHRQAAAGLAKLVREAARPVLVVIDYAETRPEETSALVDELAVSPSAYPVRLLLLSRAAGTWCDNLTEVLGQHATRLISLQPLTKAGHDRSAAWVAAVTGLARRLVPLPDIAGGSLSAQRWDTLAGELAAHPPSLEDPRLGNALSLQISALAGLLVAASGEPPVAVGEADLLRHERGYLRRSAARRHLFNPGVLSDRTDDDERTAQAWHVLERALAAIILLGPCGPDQARAAGALASATQAEDVAAWPAGLYPPANGEAGIGTVHPDRLAELMLGPLLATHSDIPSQIGALAETIDDAYQVLFTLVRTSAHPAFARAAEAATDLIAIRPVLFAPAALDLAATLPQPGPLREGLVRLGRQDPWAFSQAVYPVAEHLPRFSLSGAAFSTAVSMTLTEILRLLSDGNRDIYLPNLASALNNLAVRLADVGRREEALSASQEAEGAKRPGAWGLVLCRKPPSKRPGAGLSALPMRPRRVLMQGPSRLRDALDSQAGRVRGHVRCRGGDGRATRGQEMHPSPAGLC